MDRTQNTLDVVTAQVERAWRQEGRLPGAGDLLNAQVSLLQAATTPHLPGQPQERHRCRRSGSRSNWRAVTLPTESTPATATVNGAPAAVGTGVDAGQDASQINQLAEVAYQGRPDIAQARQNVEATQTNASLARVQTGVQATADFTAAHSSTPNYYDSE
jgi:hypothetical protein